MRFVLLFVILGFMFSGCSSNLDSTRINNPDEVSKIVYDEADTVVMAEYDGELYVFEDGEPKYHTKISDPEHDVVIDGLFALVWSAVTMVLLFSIVFKEL